MISFQDQLITFSFNLSHSQSKFSRWLVFLFFFPENKLTFYANFLHWRRFAWMTVSIGDILHEMSILFPGKKNMQILSTGDDLHE